MDAAWDEVPVKYPYRGGTRWNLWTWADIPDARNPAAVYLRRLRVVQTPWFALYVHWIFKRDDDRDPHDHPFTFWSLILRGGYTERLFDIAPKKMRTFTSTVKTWRRWSLHQMSRRQAHMVIGLQPGTVTLLLCGPKDNQADPKNEWGFYTERGFVPWSEYDRATVNEPF